MMKVEHMIAVTFSEEELREALLLTLEGENNNLTAGSPDHRRREKIINHIKYNSCSMDWVGGRFTISVDGVADTEEF